VSVSISLYEWGGRCRGERWGRGRRRSWCLALVRDYSSPEACFPLFCVMRVGCPLTFYCECVHSTVRVGRPLPRRVEGQRLKTLFMLGSGELPLPVSCWALVSYYLVSWCLFPTLLRMKCSPALPVSQGNRYPLCGHPAEIPNLAGSCVSEFGSSSLSNAQGFSAFVLSFVGRLGTLRRGPHSGDAEPAGSRGLAKALLPGHYVGQGPPTP